MIFLKDILSKTINQLQGNCFFVNHHVPRARLKKTLKVEKLNNLVQPAPTRWGTISACFKSLTAADNVLKGILSQRDFVNEGTANQEAKSTEIKNIITDPEFVIKLDECIRILKPIDVYIKIFQSDAAPCSEVYRCFLDLEDNRRAIEDLKEG